jgi:hypothetical protein
MRELMNYSQNDEEEYATANEENVIVGDFLEEEEGNFFS